jgi:hypothetical protein
MKLGITGTRHGATIEQLRSLNVLIAELKPTELHHGDCNGVDAQAAQVARDLLGFDVRIVCHPPADETHRAWTQINDEMRLRLSHFASNRNIVDETDTLIAVPMQAEHQPRGGTWYTYDYALKRGNRVILIRPSGEVVET